MRIPSHWKATIFGIALLGLYGCGNHAATEDDTDSQLPALSDSQKSQLKTTANSFNSIETLAVQAGEPNPTPSPSPTGTSGGGAGIEATAPTDEKTVGNCEIVSNAPQLTPSVGISTFSYKVSGTGCPVSLDHEININFDSSGQKGAGNLKFDYSVETDTFRSRNDLDAVTIEGPVSIDGESSSLSLKGTIHSQQQGNIAVSLSGSRDAKNSITRVRFEFPGFSAALRASTLNGQVRYFLNREKISPEEYQTYLPAVTTTTLEGK